jgi:protein gp37
MVPEHRGLTVMTKHGPRWTGEVRFLPERLSEPLHWRKPRRVFVNSMSDLFHEALTNEQIAAVFGVMAAAPRHTFQVLTKRTARMREWFAWALGFGELRSDALRRMRFHADQKGARGIALRDVHADGVDWPLGNAWIGVSAEDQATADERVPDLLACPAAVRWVSYEPAIGPVDFTPWLFDPRHMGSPTSPESLAWIVCGAESGPKARPFALDWMRATIAACRDSGTPVFCKQVGPHPYETAAANLGAMQGYDPSDLLAGSDEPRPPQMAGWTRMRTATETWWQRHHKMRDRKGGDMSEWPAELRVQNFPGAPR